MKASTSVGLRALLASLALVVGWGAGIAPANATPSDAKPRAGASASVSAAPAPSARPARPAGAASTTSAATVQSAPRSYELTTSRVHLHDLGIVVEATTDVDLGPSPPLGSTRTIERAEIVQALEAANLRAPGKIPDRVKVTRKGRHLSPTDVDRLVRSAIDPARMPRGATLGAVRGASVEVPDGFDNITADLPTLARRAGTVPALAQLSFWLDGAVIAKIQVPLEVVVPAEALVPDVVKGAAILLLVRRGLVEVSIGAVAGADGDTGGILPVLLKPSGRMIRARVLDKDHAVSIEDP
jgi:hypothetical protein